jgi:hypothetical protein
MPAFSVDPVPYVYTPNSIEMFRVKPFKNASLIKKGQTTPLGNLAFPMITIQRITIPPMVFRLPCL